MDYSILEKKVIKISEKGYTHLMWQLVYLSSYMMLLILDVNICSMLRSGSALRKTVYPSSSSSVARQIIFFTLCELTIIRTELSTRGSTNVISM